MVVSQEVVHVYWPGIQRDDPPPHLFFLKLKAASVELRLLHNSQASSPQGSPPPPGLKPRCIVEFSNTLRYSDVYRSRKTVALNRFAELAAFRDIRDNLFAGLQL